MTTPLTPESVLMLSSFGSALGIALLYYSYCFKPWLFFSPWGQGQMDLLQVCQFCNTTPTVAHSIGGEVPIFTKSISLLPLSMWSLYPLLCGSCSVSPQFFFRRNCFIYRCRFSVSMEDVHSGLSSHHLIPPLVQSF